MKSLWKLYKLNKGLKKLYDAHVYLVAELGEELLADESSDRFNSLVSAGAILINAHKDLWREVDALITGIVQRIQGVRG